MCATVGALILSDYGAVQALQDVHWAFSEPLHGFHPRAYNLSQESDFAQFDVDFKWTAAAAVLRVLLRDGGFHPLRVPSEDVARLALTVCQARLSHLRCALGATASHTLAPPCIPALR